MKNFSTIIYDPTVSENESLRAAINDENAMQKFDQQQHRHSINTETYEPQSHRRMLTNQSPRQAWANSPLKPLNKTVCNNINRPQQIQIHYQNSSSPMHKMSNALRDQER